MATARIPVSMMTSLVLHAGAMMAYISATKMSPSAATHMVGNVDLMIQVHHEVPLPTKAASKPPPPKGMLDMFKMALPSIPKIQAIDVKAPDENRVKPLLAGPKLEDRSRHAAGPVMPKIDLSSKHSMAAANLDALEPVAHHTAAIAQMPRLEDVGVHKVKNLVRAQALEDRRREASDEAILQGINMPAPTHVHIAPAAAIQALSDATPEQKAKYSAIANMLPAEDARHEVQAQMHAPSDDLLKKMQKPTPKRDQAAILPNDSHKGVEIEGDLKDRQVVSSEIPAYPDRLKSLGIPEILVKLDFCVESNGDVVNSSIKPEESSGYGWLDRSTGESLKNWKFAPLGSNERQCGAITFRFELE